MVLNPANNDFIKKVSVLIGGNAIGQLILIGFSPILTRLYEPELFGIFALFMAYCSIVSCISTGCYERAILLAENEQKAFAVSVLSFTILVITTFWTVLGVLILKTDTLSAFVPANYLRGASMALPVAVFLLGSEKIIRFWNIRNKQFVRISGAKAAEAGSSSAIKILIAVFLGVSVGGLIAGFLVGLIVAILLKGKIFITEPWLGNSAQITIKQIKETSQKYKGLPLYGTWNALLKQTTKSSVVFVLSYFFMPTVVGLYQIANRMLQQPIIIISESIQNVCFQRLGEKAAQGKPVYSDFVKITLGMFFTGMIPFALLATYAQPLFAYVFGEEWGQAGRYVQILSPWFFVLFLRSPANITYEVYNHHQMRLLLNFLNLITSLFAIVITAIMFNSPYGCLVVYSLVNVVFGVLVIVVAGGIAKKHQKIYNISHLNA